MSKIGRPTLEGKWRREMIVTFIKDYTHQFGYPPSVLDIAKGVGIKSTGATAEHLNRLKSEGRITWKEGFARTISVINQNEK